MPGKQDLVVLQDPCGGQVFVPFVNLVLGVGHAQQSEVLLHGRGSRGAFAEDRDVDGIGEAGVEVAHVAAGFSRRGDGGAVADVVGSTVHVPSPRGKAQLDPLLGLEHDWIAGGTVGGCVGRRGVGRVRDVFNVHCENVLSGQHTVDGRKAPVVGFRGVGREHAGQDLVLKAGECAWFGQ